MVLLFLVVIITYFSPSPMQVHDSLMVDRDVHPSPLSDKEHLEKAKRCEFVQGLLLSTIFDGGL